MKIPKNFYELALLPEIFSWKTFQIFSAATC